ncbi:MAG: LOG family protein, partial [Methyloceanibacter sp.]
MDDQPSPIPAISRICVYCGSGTGRNPAFAKAARDLGRALAKAGIGLVYGGGSLGLMGELAHSVIRHGGHVAGIIPGFLNEREHMLTEANELIVVDDMHQRKHLMFS